MVQFASLKAAPKPNKHRKLGPHASPARPLKRRPAWIDIPSGDTATKSPGKHHGTPNKLSREGHHVKKKLRRLSSLNPLGKTQMAPTIQEQRDQLPIARGMFWRNIIGAQC